MVADASAVALCKGEGRCGEAGMQLGAGEGMQESKVLRGATRQSYLCLVWAYLYVVWTNLRISEGDLACFVLILFHNSDSTKAPKQASLKELSKALLLLSRAMIVNERVARTLACSYPARCLVMHILCFITVSWLYP